MSEEGVGICGGEAIPYKQSGIARESISLSTI